MIVLARLNFNNNNHIRHINPPMMLKQMQAQINGSILFDEAISSISFLDYISDHSSQIKFIIIEGNSTQYSYLKKLYNKIKRINNYIKIIAVGQQCIHSFKNKDLEFEQIVDYPLLGESELIIPEIISGKLTEQEVFQSYKLGRFHYITELEKLLPVQFNAQEQFSYIFPLPINGRQIKRWGYVISAYGCPHNCGHCSVVVRKSHGISHRKKNVKQIIKEIKMQIENGVEALLFDDDTLFCDSKHFKELCTEIIKHNIQVPWVALARPDEITEEKIKLGKKAGLSLLKIGIESFEEPVIKSLAKTNSPHLWLKHVNNALKLCNQYNVDTLGLLMIGCPKENKFFLKKLSNQLQRLNYIQIQIFTLYPDIPLYDKLKNQNFNKEHHYIGSKELINLRSTIYKNFYFNFKYIYKFVIKNYSFIVSNVFNLNHYLKSIMK